ncbi:MAG TPA: hypothetical protein EYG81_00395 [Archaeoglobus profundus]|nr:hypothetical protein [Archaeoglobus profundus]
MWESPFPLSATNVTKVIKVAESQNGYCLAYLYLYKLFHPHLKMRGSVNYSYKRRFRFFSFIIDTLHYL